MNPAWLIFRFTIRVLLIFQLTLWKGLKVLEGPTKSCHWKVRDLFKFVSDGLVNHPYNIFSKVVIGPQSDHVTKSLIRDLRIPKGVSGDSSIHCIPHRLGGPCKGWSWSYQHENSRSCYNKPDSFFKILVSGSEIPGKVGTQILILCLKCVYNYPRYFLEVLTQFVNNNNKKYWELYVNVNILRGQVEDVETGSPKKLYHKNKQNHYHINSVIKGKQERVTSENETSTLFHNSEEGVNLCIQGEVYIEEVLVVGILALRPLDPHIDVFSFTFDTTSTLISFILIIIFLCASNVHKVYHIFPYSILYA